MSKLQQDYQVRYTSEIYGSALHSTHTDYDTARAVRLEAIRTALENGQPRLAKSFEIV